MKLRLGEEMSKKYLSGCVRVRTHAGAEPIIGFIDNYTEMFPGEWPSRSEATKVRLKFIGNDGKQSMMSINLVDYILDFSLPNFGYVNFPKAGVCMYFSQQHQKQWKRNLSAGTYASELNSAGRETAEFKSSVLKHLSPGVKFYNQLYNNKLYNLHDAVRNILSGKWLTVAIARNYAVGVDKLYPENIVVYYKNIVIGVVDKNLDDYVIRIPEEARHFLEDLSQYAPVLIK